jgi:hypothetical protein
MSYCCKRALSLSLSPTFAAADILGIENQSLSFSSLDLRYERSRIVIDGGPP